VNTECGRATREPGLTFGIEKTYGPSMLVVHVHIHVLPEALPAFISATEANAKASLLEEGVARFDLLQEKDDPTRFLLVEAYKDAGAPAKHKETAHYAAWRDAVLPMMASPRTSVKFESLYPEEPRWQTPA
jgi:(4S)-4-hydroxy-5-phosphonooxypentane-2,3-dione isomerase